MMVWVLNFFLSFGEGYYSWCATWGTFSHMHTFGTPLGFICMAFYLELATNDGLGGQIKKNLLVL